MLFTKFVNKRTIAKINGLTTFTEHAQAHTKKSERTKTEMVQQIPSKIIIISNIIATKMRRGSTFDK